jgi:putative ABC transport system substrate-binding protein
MRRREFITLVRGSAAAWPLAARAQQAAKPVIGNVGAQSQQFYADRLNAFNDGLNEIGLREGLNVALEYWWAENDPSRLPELLSDLAIATWT